MCPKDDSHLTVEYEDHYVIKPTIQHHTRQYDYLQNAVKETAKSVESNFEYNSENNPIYLSVEEIRERNRLLEH